MSTSINISPGSAYAFRIIPFNDNFRGHAYAIESQARALSGPQSLDGFAEVRQEKGDCFCNLSTLLSFVSPAPSLSSPRLGFLVEMSNEPSFSSNVQLAMFEDRYDDGQFDFGIDASLDKDNLGDGGSARLHQRIRILSSLQGVLREYVNESSALLYNLSHVDGFYSGMGLSAQVNGVSKVATIAAYNGANRAAYAMFDDTPTPSGIFSIGTRLVHIQGGLPTHASDNKFLTIDSGTRYYFRVSGYSRAGISTATTYSLQVSNASPRTLPAKGGQLVEITGTGLGFKPESFSIFIGGVPCHSVSVKDKAGTRITWHIFGE